MNTIRHAYTLLQKISAAFMILALLWLTVSIPFVYAAQQVQAEHEKNLGNANTPMSCDEEAANPFGSTTEEKAPNNTSVSFSEEYLHDHHQNDYIFSIDSKYHKCENAATYVAFHGELLVPPPNVA